ncbi:MAG TPA: hypothetical protein DDY57_17880 [Franconibacter pulveris]|nr:hypothetical protein [Franconibacter pulveris]
MFVHLPQTPHLTCKSPASFKPQRRWLLSPTQVTYLSKLPGMRSLAALLRLEIFRTKPLRCLL